MVQFRRVLHVLVPFALLAATTAGAAPDLEVEALDASALVADCGSRLTTGSLLVSVRNLGDEPAADIRVYAFDDRDGDGEWSAADVLAGELILAADPEPALAPGALVQGAIEISLLQDFPADLLFVAVDPLDAIAEADEGNNVRHTGLSAA